jgi:hypothetical protein
MFLVAAFGFTVRLQGAALSNIDYSFTGQATASQAWVALRGYGNNIDRVAFTFLTGSTQTLLNGVSVNLQGRSDNTGRVVDPSGVDPAPAGLWLGITTTKVSERYFRGSIFLESNTLFPDTGSVNFNVSWNSQPIILEANTEYTLFSYIFGTTSGAYDSSYIFSTTDSVNSFQSDLGWSSGNTYLINDVYMYSVFGSNPGPTLDSFSVTQLNRQLSVSFDATVVPEPSTYALFGLGVFGLMIVLRRKKTA